MSAYITRETFGHCKVCDKWKDLRFGVCFTCADHVKTDGKWVWDERDPDRKWPNLAHAEKLLKGDSQ